MPGLIERYFEKKAKAKALKKLRKSIQKVFSTPVRDLLEPHPPDILASAKMAIAHKRMYDERLSCLIVIENQKPIGILQERAFLADEIFTEEFKNFPVKKFMVPAPRLIKSSSTMKDVLEQIQKQGHMGVLVQLEQNIGIISVRRLLQSFESCYTVVTEEVDVLPKISNFKLEQADWISLDDKVIKVRDKLKGTKIGCVLVHDLSNPGTIRGLVSERDILSELYKYGAELSKFHSVNIMQHPVVTIRSDKDLFEASRLFVEHGFRRLPVREDEGCIGVLTPQQVFGFFKQFLQKT